MTEYTNRNPGVGRNSRSRLSKRRRHTKNHKESPLTGKRRGWILFIGICITAFCVFLLYSLYDLQINQYEYYSQLASRQHWKRIQDEPVRGNILDAKGNTLASTTYVYTVGITPSDLRSLTNKAETPAIAANIASSLGLDIEVVNAAVADTKASYVQLAKNLPKDKIDVFNAYIKANNIGGTKVDAVAKRYYSNGSLASQVLGYANATDGILFGQLGIESEYNSVLTGKEGYTYVEVDNYSGGALPYSPPTTIAAEDGYNVVLNIDQNIQEIAENACKEVNDIYNVIDGVTAIVMNPYTGAVLGMASYPDFDPNNPTAEPDWVDPAVWSTLSDKDQTTFIMSEAWRNRAISDTYEPGSTFKAFTTAIALEEGLTTEDEEFSDAPIAITTVDTISCWKQKTDGTNHGIETLKKAFENSCNPIFVQLALRIGIDKYYEYVHSFGFYNQTGVDLPSEGVGIFHKAPTKVDLATLSFGESSTVTPLQLANAYCALVNGGTLMTPQIAKCLTDKNGNIVKEFQPEAIRTIFSEETANRIRKLMEGVVTEGTGTAGYVEGYNVAGKTSTSTTENGKYAGLHVLSFGGYAPANDPQIVVLVVVNKPADKLVASSCATKAAANIVSRTLEYLDIKHVYTEDDYTKLTTKYSVPDVTGKTYREARAILYIAGFTAVDGEDNMDKDALITSTFPAKDAAVYKNGQVVLYSGTTAETDMKQVVIPDFTGKDIAECIKEAGISGVNIDIEGDCKGTVISQSLLTPAATEGTPSEEPTGTPTPAAEISAAPTGTEVTVTPPAGQTMENTLTKVAMGTIIHIVMAA
ncbi:MAG: penicillin-binding transpeptidase domain-containing protein [Eubacteriales bacterium]